MTGRRMPMGGSLEEWVDYYEGKTGAKCRFNSLETIEFDPEKGFMSWWLTAEDTDFHLGKVCGDGPWWEGRILSLARGLGCRKIVSFTLSPRFFLRKYKGKIRGFIMEREVE